ncbi:Mlo127p LALA0_S05e01530g [Lachancea lanzarotensis]|uniref:LALA0S05e01530g1_1 n=1 Tax=Lachancea lanzarotensis TaxID=1245769 RepID=A0A0C7N2P9_9SACH|nr:uncharacterized protein LALA0_S05e01530g [Lachancea lanzarotensis]CEP62263.1 LALA0S05e01530g1_1 [Lachancea lanzarotensis]
MNNDSDSFDLDPNLVVSALRSPLIFVTSFLFNDETLLVVKNRELSVFAYLKDQESPIYRSETSKTVLEVRPCPGAEFNGNYAIIFYESGEVEVRNHRLQILDSAKLSLLQQHDQKPLVAVDAKFSRFFVTWDRRSVIKVNYAVGPTTLKLSTSQNASDVMFRSPHPIRALTTCWNTVESEDFYQMCILSQPLNSNFPTVEIWEELDLIRNKWELVIKSKSLDALPRDASYGHVSLISRTNMGFVCFLPTSTLIYDAQKAFLSQRPRFDTLKKSLNAILGLKTADVRIFPALEQSTGRAQQFIGCTNEGEFFRLQLSTLFEKKENSECASLISPEFSRDRLDSVDNCIHLRGSQFLIPTTHMGLIIFDLSDKKSIVIPCRIDSVLYSTVSGDFGNFRRLLVSGGSSGNEGFLECTFLACEASIHLSPLAHITNLRIVDFWLTKKGVFWLDSNGILYNDTGRVTYGNVLHVDLNGIFTLCQDDILLVEPIKFTQKLVFVKKNGTISWGQDGLNLPIPGFESATSTSYHVSSTQLPDASELTVVSWNSESIWFSSNRSKSVKLLGLSQVCDCLVKVWEDNTWLIFIDIFGNTQIYNTDGTLRSQFKISGHKFYLQDLQTSNRFLISCVDSIFMVSLQQSKIEAGEVNLPLRLKKMKVALGTTLIGLGNDSNFYQCDVSELLNSSFLVTKKSYRNHSHIYTKHLTIPISRRFVITSAVTQRYDKAQDKIAYESEIHVHDITAGQVAQKYPISSLFPQALISDLSALKFHKRVLWGKYSDNYTSFAKQLIFSRCFLVSLSFDFAEDDLQENLLLFTLDDETGEIELQLKTRVEFSVTSLYNYSNRMIFAAGESIQALLLDYSAKEGSFSLKTVSKALTLDSFAGYCFAFSRQGNQSVVCDEQPRGKRQKVLSQHEIIGVHSLVKGIQELEITADVAERKLSGGLTLGLKEVFIKHQRISDYSEASHYLSDLRFSSDVKMGFNENRTLSDASSFAAVNEDGDVTIMYLHHDDGEGIFLGAQFAGLPSVTGLSLADISSAEQNGAEIMGGLNRTYTQLREKFMPLFLLNTSNGGCYLVSTIISQRTLEEFIEASGTSETSVREHLNCEEMHLFGSDHKLADEPKNCIFG